ncbi:M48 family metallopeptidase [Kiloniella laminariae]|uniref:M48 family metallopeptidase n=1 Tax=Kiloniella laminariae TaxID=454162 RepID=UPI00039BE66A|nr:M48 family metallopeptidase [Kiloniella laminariae]
MTSTTLQSEEKNKTCPDCDSITHSHKGFRQWCPQCNWNLGSDDFVNTLGYTAKIYRKIGITQGDRVFQSILSEKPEDLRPRWSLSKILAFAFASTIHLASIAMAALGLYALSFGWPAVLLIVIGILLLALSWFIRPRLGAMPQNCLKRADAPALFAVCDRIADKVGSPRVDGIEITPDYNAAFARVGISRKVLIVIGLPLWLVQTWPERLAILAHEFSHGANGDSTRSLIIGSALNTLDYWIYILRHKYDQDSTIIQMITHYLLWILSWFIELLYIGLSHLVWRQSQKAEFLADYLATTASGTEAMRDALKKFSYGEHLQTFANRTIFSAKQSQKQILTKFVSYFKALPKSETERLDRIANQKNARLDATHPPTRQRMAFITAHPIADASITVSKEEQHLIESELEKLEETIGQQLISYWAPER